MIARFGRRRRRAAYAARSLALRRISVATQRLQHRVEHNVAGRALRDDDDREALGAVALDEEETQLAARATPGEDAVDAALAERAVDDARRVVTRHRVDLARGFVGRPPIDRDA